ncbi:unnamed protein product [Effrenium voratum]|nr:unnamed protein product [Effrenium voratum]
MKPSTAPAEWPGAVSAKFTDKLTGLPLRRKPIDAPFKYGAQEGLARNGFGRYFTDEDGLIPNQMKRFIPMPDSQTLVWRPGKRPLAEPGLSNIEKPEGLARVESFCAKVYTTSEKRHIRQLESKEEIQDRPWGKRTVYRENRLRASDQPAREIDITTEMRRKARVEDLLLQRNLIECYTLGDKHYRQPEYAPEFYKAGGLIAGSTFHRGMHKKTQSRSSASMLVTGEGAKRHAKTYLEKQAEQEVAEAQAEVEALTGFWELDTLKECDKTYCEPLDSDEEDLKAA